MSEDLVCCRGDATAVLPGPALLRLRPDVYDGTLPEGLSVAAARPDRIFVSLGAARRGTSAPVPLRGIVFLRESSDLRIEHVLAKDSLRDLWHLSFREGTTEGRAESFRRLTHLAGVVPVWNLHRPIELSSLEATVEVLHERVAR